MDWITRYGFTVLVLHFFLVSNIKAAAIDITGYASLIGTYTDEKDVTYLNEYADNFVDFTHHSHIGLQFNTEIVEDLDFSLTLLAEGAELYQVQASWFYATYAMTQNSSLRFGRLKVPLFLVSNYIDIGHAYPWVTPPEEVYTTNVIESPEGLEYIYETELLSSDIQFNTYVGSDRNETVLSPAFPIGGSKVSGDKVSFEAHDIFGLQFNIVTDHITFNLSHNQSVIDIKDLSITRSRMSIGSFGIILDIGNFILYSELTHRDSEQDLQTIFPDQNSKYLTFGYRFSKFLPFITLANIDKGKTKSKYAVIQESTTFGMRYDVNKKMDVKFQATKIKPGFEDGDVGRFGLFDGAIEKDKEPMLFSMSIDILF